MVALGESVVAVGIGGSGVGISWEMLTVAILGLALSAELWWVYFMATRRPRGRCRMTPTRPEFYATNAANYWAHLLMLLGIVCISAALEEAIAHAFDPLSFALALALGGGTAPFLLGHALFRLFLGLPPHPWRALAALLALATVAIGPATEALVQLAVLVAALGACLCAEEVFGRSTSSAVRTRLRPSDLAS
jgi:low temperature requirement protein LtrA